jgi:hypothetical protein
MLDWTDFQVPRVVGFRLYQPNHICIPRNPS